MLTVPFFINEKQIACLKINRINSIEVNQLSNKHIYCDYKVIYENNAYPDIEFEISHDYHKGCESLVARALRKVKRIQVDKGYNNPSSSPEYHVNNIEELYKYFFQNMGR